MNKVKRLAAVLLALLVPAAAGCSDGKVSLDDGLLLGYGFSHSITLVKRIIAACYAQNISDYNIEELDLTPIRPLYQELLETIENYKAAAEDPNQLMAEPMTADETYHIGTQIDRMAFALDWMSAKWRAASPSLTP